MHSFSKVSCNSLLQFTLLIEWLLGSSGRRSKIPPLASSGRIKEKFLFENGRAFASVRVDNTLHVATSYVPVSEEEGLHMYRVHGGGMYVHGKYVQGKGKKANLIGAAWQKYGQINGITFLVPFLHAATTCPEQVKISHEHQVCQGHCLMYCCELPPLSACGFS